MRTVKSHNTDYLAELSIVRHDVKKLVLIIGYINHYYRGSKVYQHIIIIGHHSIAFVCFTVLEDCSVDVCLCD